MEIIGLSSDPLWIKALSVLWGWAIFLIGTAVVIFTVIGISTTYTEWSEKKRKRQWQKEYGAMQEQEREKTERKEWEEEEREKARAFLLEQVIRRRGMGDNIDIIDKIIKDIDYDSIYNDYRRVAGEWKVYSLSSMSGGLGSSENAQADIDKDIEEYQEQRKRELRDKLDQMLEKGQ